MKLIKTLSLTPNIKKKKMLRDFLFAKRTYNTKIPHSMQVSWCGILT